MLSAFFDRILHAVCLPILRQARRAIFVLNSFTLSGLELYRICRIERVRNRMETELRERMNQMKQTTRQTENVRSRIEGRKIGSLVESERSVEEPSPRVRRRNPEGNVSKESGYLSENMSLGTRYASKGTATELHYESPNTTQRTGNGGWKERMKERKRKRIRLALTAGGVVLLCLYTAAAVYFGSHFYAGTMICGIDCSQMTAAQVKEEVSEKLDQYVLQVVGRNDRIESLTAEQIDLKFVDNNSIDRMLRSQHSYIWPVMLLLERSSLSSVAFSYDQKKAEAALSSLNCMNASIAVAPRDAYLAVTDQGFEIVPEVMGTTLDAEKTVQTVLAALEQGADKVLLEEKDCYVNPEIYSTDEALNKEKDGKAALAQAYITYDFGDRTELVNAPVIADWIVQSVDGTYVIDDMAVTAYVEALAAKYDTFGLTRTFYTSIGTVETLSGGDYGWCIDQNATVVALMQALESGYQGTMEPVYLFSGMCRDTNDIGDTYVEICISQQRMWCYKDGVCIVDTPVVTGNPNKDNATPSGSVWAIDAMKRDAVLEGEGYEAPVDYWMPFNGDVGIHDLKERSEFGGSIYLSNGSHGCVNTPYEAVQTIYEAVSIGTPVIVYE